VFNSYVIYIHGKLATGFAGITLSSNA